jgi:hypothetical protein
MAEAIPPTDDSELTEKFQRTQELLLWCKFAEKYLYPKEDSVVALAGRLKIWQAVESQDPHLEEDLLSFYRETAQKTKDRVVQACLSFDHSFLRRLLDAAALAAEGKVSQSLGTHRKAKRVTRVGLHPHAVPRRFRFDRGNCPSFL